MRAFAVSLLSAFVALASAYTQPDYSKNPSGNAIALPGLNDEVPVGEPYTITWDPTTKGPVSLVLLRGPSTNVVPLVTIAENIPNNGKYVWTPSTDLEPDVTHYGLLLVDDPTGQYQYSTQFGISNSKKEVSTSSSSAVATTSSSTTVVAPVSSETTTVAASTMITPTSVMTTTICSTSSVTSAPVSIVSVSVPVVSPSKTPAGPSTLRSSVAVPTGASSTTPAASPMFTGAAGRNAISLGAVAAGVVAVLAF
jgi:hypothetical protein